MVPDKTSAVNVEAKPSQLIKAYLNIREDLHRESSSYIPSVKAAAKQIAEEYLKKLDELLGF